MSKYYTEKSIINHLVVYFLLSLFMRMMKEALNKNVSAERIRQTLKKGFIRTLI
ncbi:hypothetical protein THEYE_A0104 [Thermodesulfovibrio yellowstonii DSM 11347]|uniref:Uncharacterized protein n=1 Tax=Thermodesulfovibrio yellowstonii (strain ATCC 51303 / DSM 11347 / YP87) TaxID=289376 RepID=B5YHD4_THEYD|nr:hypothetical protein THEYE_A0104 [Thermodesulfovibrio yellowstonii DSM 11347]